MLVDRALLRSYPGIRLRWCEITVLEIQPPPIIESPIKYTVLQVTGSVRVCYPDDVGSGSVLPAGRLQKIPISRKGRYHST